jgi:hypothetical protein
VIILLILTAFQADFTVKELADYRLTVPVFRKFEQASGLIATATHADAKLAENPLFTREVSVLGDAPVVAAELEARLQRDASLAGALRASNISAREYAKFALALFGARLAHGFMKSGALRVIPAGVATENVAFVEAHEAKVAVVLQLLGVEAPQQERAHPMAASIVSRCKATRASSVSPADTYPPARTNATGS